MLFSLIETFFRIRYAYGSRKTTKIISTHSFTGTCSPYLPAEIFIEIRASTLNWSNSRIQSQWTHFKKAVTHNVITKAQTVKTENAAIYRRVCPETSTNHVPKQEQMQNLRWIHEKVFDISMILNLELEGNKQSQNENCRCLLQRTKNSEHFTPSRWPIVRSSTVQSVPSLIKSVCKCWIAPNVMAKREIPPFPSNIGLFGFILTVTAYMISLWAQKPCDTDDVGEGATPCLFISLREVPLMELWRLALLRFECNKTKKSTISSYL